MRSPKPITGNRARRAHWRGRRMIMEYEVVIGMEIHAQLLTKSKLFCGCSTEFGAEPNSQCCPICLGFPGSLPMMNRKAVDHIITTALALNCTVARESIFARKNYFYPDLPKAYQISQDDQPLGEKGYLDIMDSSRRIRIRRIHLEEDAGKLVHTEGEPFSLVDYNRGGASLMEIVTEPDIRSAEEAAAYITELRSILRYIGVCDGNMEEGSLRCEPNISLRLRGAKEFGVKVELKNINSIRAVQRGVAYEVERQSQILNEGGTVIQETRRWDEANGVTISMRSKEEAHDYRYFPEADLVRVVVDNAWLNRMAAALPELPQARRERFIAAYGLPAYDAGVLTESKEIGDFFDKVAAISHDYKAVSNWIMGELMRLLNETGQSLEQTHMTPEVLAEIIALVDKGAINLKSAKEVFEESFRTGKAPSKIVADRGMTQISDEAALSGIIEDVIAANSKVAEDFQAGKEAALGFLVGQVMKETRGQANPAIVNKLLREKL